MGIDTASALVFIYEGAGRMAQWVKELVAKHGDLSSILGSHIVKERANSHMSSDLYICTVAHVFTHTQI